MSTDRYGWMGFARWMVRKYPERAAALGDLHAMKVTARYSLEPGGGGPERTTEAVATRQLPEDEQKEYDAVRAALERVIAAPDADARLKLIRMVHWDRSCGLYAAAQKIGISEITAKRWNGSFLRDVGRNYGWHPKR